MRLAVTRTGTGTRSIILLHGFLGSGRNLATLARSWAAADPTRSFLLMDLTGHGISPPLPPGAGLEVLARDVLETAVAEGLQPPFTIVGHSLGGRVALQAVLLDPSRLRHVTLLDIAPGPIGDAGEDQSRTMRAFAALPDRFADRESARQGLLAQGLPKALAEWLLTNLIATDDGYRWRVDRHALQELRPRMNAVDLWPAVERDGHAMRCLRGELSPYVTDEDVARLERLHCRVDTLPGAGHFLHVDQPKPLLDLLLSTTP